MLIGMCGGGDGVSCCRPRSSVDPRRLNQSSGVILQGLNVLMRAVKCQPSITLGPEFSEEQVIARRDSLSGGGRGGGGGLGGTGGFRRRSVDGKPSAVKGHTRHERPRLVPSEGGGADV